MLIYFVNKLFVMEFFSTTSDYRKAHPHGGKGRAWASKLIAILQSIRHSYLVITDLLVHLFIPRALQHLVISQTSDSEGGTICHDNRLLNRRGITTLVEYLVKQTIAYRLNILFYLPLTSFNFKVKAKIINNPVKHKINQR